MRGSLFCVCTVRRIRLFPLRQGPGLEEELSHGKNSPTHDCLVRGGQDVVACHSVHLLDDYQPVHLVDGGQLAEVGD